MSDRPVLAELEIPDETLLLLESMGIEDPDRTENRRFYFRQDGCFFYACNTQLFVADESQFKSDDPTLFWNKPFTELPDRCLDEQHLTELVDAIHNANFSSLNEFYIASTEDQRSHREIERWTVVINKEIKTVIVEVGNGPKQLLELRTIIDQLLTETVQQ